MPKDTNSSGQIDGESKVRQSELESLDQDRAELERRVDFETERSSTDGEPEGDAQVRIRRPTTGIRRACRSAIRLNHDSADRTSPEASGGNIALASPVDTLDLTAYVFSEPFASRAFMRRMSSGKPSFLMIRENCWW
jgi:hypothetical protein